MKGLILSPLLLLASCATTSAATTWTEGVTLSPINSATRVDAAFIMGKPGEPGVYTIRVHIREGGLMPPHTHPDARQITVVSGDLYYGFGTTPDVVNTERYPVGSYFIVPANAPHYAMGVKGDAVYQESGMAPTSTDWVK